MPAQAQLRLREELRGGIAGAQARLVAAHAAAARGASSAAGSVRSARSATSARAPSGGRPEPERLCTSLGSAAAGRKGPRSPLGPPPQNSMRLSAGASSQVAAGACPPQWPLQPACMSVTKAV